MVNLDNELILAFELLKLGKVNESEEIVKKITKKTPSNLNALLLMGLISVYNKNYSYAVDLLTRFTRKINNHPIAYTNLGIAYLELNKIENSIKSFDASLKLKPDNPDALFYLGNAYSKLNLYNQAEQSYIKAIEHNSEFIDAYYSLGLLFYEQSAFNKALDVYKKILSHWPNDIVALNQAGHLCFLLEIYVDSIPYFNTSLDLKVDQSEALKDRAFSYLKINELELAMKDCNLALKFNPNLCMAHNIRALIYDKLGNIEQAIDECDQAIKINENDVDARNNRASFFINQNFLEEALEECNRLVSMDKANALTYFHIGLIFTKKNESEKALRAFDKAIELDSNNSDYYHNRGIVLLALGNFDQAIYNYKKAIDLGGNISLSKASLGLIEMRLKKFNAGWDNYEFRIDGLDGSKEILKICSENYAYWDGNKVCKGVLVIGEQGLGDIILFASLLPELIETELKIHLIIEPRLVNLFRRSFKNITITPQIKENFSIQFLKNMSFDQYILIGSLGKFYRKSLDDFKNNPKPYLKFDLDQSKRLKKSLKSPNHLLCGISWRSENFNTGSFKSIPLNELSKAFDLKKIDLVNLQYSDVNIEIQNAKDNNIFISQVDEIDNKNDIDGLASLISACDFVVTISNTTAHLAGSLGIKTYLLLPYSYGSLWYWHDDHHSLWYPSIRIFRQDESRNWLTVIHELSEHLKKEHACV